MQAENIRRPAKKVDPVLPDQGGRTTPGDPLDPIHLTREEAIRERAFELYQQRDREDGHALDDWLAAEAQMNGLSLPGEQNVQHPTKATALPETAHGN